MASRIHTLLHNLEKVDETFHAYDHIMPHVNHYVLNSMALGRFEWNFS